MKLIALLLLALSACTATPPEPVHKAGAHLAAKAGHIRIDDHGWCVIQPDGMEACSILGRAPTIAPPHHHEDIGQ